MTRSATMAHFLTSCLLNIYNLHRQMYSLVRFQLRMPITLGTTALRSSSNRKINLYARYWENKLQVLTKMMVTYEQKKILSYNLHHHVCHEWRDQILCKFFCLSPFFTAKKGEINEEKLIA